MSAIIGPNISDFFDLSLHWASVVRGTVLNPVLTNLLSASSPVVARFNEVVRLVEV